MVLVRLGLPSLFALVVWLPLVEHTPMLWGWVVGLSCVALVDHARASRAYDAIWIGCGIGIGGVGLVSLMGSWIPLDVLVVPLVGAALFMAALSTFSFRVEWAVGLGSVLALGWWGLHAWVIPAALPALLIGWWGVSSPEGSAYENPSRREHVGAALLGCAAGFLPGLGPGLMRVFDRAHRPAAALGVSNLVFSLGLVALNGKVRSVAAGALSMSALPEWIVVVAWVGVGVVVAYGVSECILPASFSFSSRVWIGVHLLGVVLVGGLASLVLCACAACMRRALDAWRLDSTWGVFVLVPSIVWFYST